jgi:hypothetical protein
LRLISILKKGEPERCLTINEKAAGKMLLILNNPATAAVPANKEEGRFRMRLRRGRFLLVHDTCPCELVTLLVARRQCEVGDPDRDFQRDTSRAAIDSSPTVKISSQERLTT